ncbi:MAG: alkaline phosphatase family protein, partial [Rhodospirillales bacterium]|nr:alkaline phosphatase family protein [Rhodospirillales bacterium]
MSASGKPDGTLPSLEVKGRTYALPDRPVAVICIDGCADEYLSTSIVHDCMPNVARIARDGYRGMARGALPSFTNVNNCAIVTGTAPNQTGMAGNYIIDPDTGEEVMTNSSKWLRNETILAAAADTGRKVAMVTAKDKLREMLAKNMHGIGFSSEKAGEATEEEHGIGDVE